MPSTFITVNENFKDRVCVSVAQARLNLLGAQRGWEFIILLPTTSQALAVGATTHYTFVLICEYFKSNQGCCNSNNCHFLASLK